jgi:hypothetical protein
MDIIKMFPTIVGSHNNKKFTDDVLPIVNKILKNREKNYLEHTNTYNDQKINEYLNGIKFITDYINFISYEYTKQIGYVVQHETELMLFTSDMKHGEYMHSHTHPNSILSGICYLDVTEKSAPIIFEDSRDIRSFNGMASAGDIDPSKYTEYNNREISFHPKNGDILIWESWMRHVVRNNTSDHRKTLVWNFSIKQ